MEAFAGAGKDVGVECWRIENFLPVKQDNVGVFCEGKGEDVGVHEYMGQLL